ncbi:MAG TPA: hypothetical protein VM658_05025 [bacterium]|nr:hypothetical protein [bacterium]
MEADHNLIILSDAHMGDKQTMERNAASRASQARELEHLFDYYRENRVDDKPWRLVIAGDLLDFVEVTALPSEDELKEAGIKLNRNRRKYGLAGTPRESAWKLGRIVTDNRPVFASLAAFIMAGNELFIISGNHDVNWIFPEVREKFLELLAGLAPEGDQVREAIASRVRFNPWFYYEPGELWVEHGHQFDPYNSFEYVLAPLHPRKNEVAPTIGTLAQRYFTNLLSNLNPYAENVAGFFEYFGWLYRVQGWDGFKTLWYYFNASARVLFMAGRLRRRRRYVAQLKAEYRLSILLGIPRRSFRRIRRVQRRPLLRSWRLTAAYVNLDKMLLVIAYIAGSIYLWWLPLSLPVTIVAIAVLITSLYGAVNLLSLGRKRLTRDSFFGSGAKVAKILGVKNVVMGHQHEPYMGSIGGRIRVLGLGAWISNQGGVDTELASAVIPSYIIVTGPPSARRLLMYTWDRESKKPRDGRELSRLEILAA